VLYDEDIFVHLSAGTQLLAGGKASLKGGEIHMERMLCYKRVNVRSLGFFKASVRIDIDFGNLLQLVAPCILRKNTNFGEYAPRPSE
jgi:hypothetical protein